MPGLSSPPPPRSVVWSRCLAAALVLAGVTLAERSSASDAGFRAGEAGLTQSERAGREIWFYATGGNGRFHTYTFQQRLGVLIDWYRVLKTESREARFKTWGLIYDPDCCVPGAAGCPAKSTEETYGFDWCPGDEVLLGFVGKTGYRDPACDFRDAPPSATDLHGPADQRQSPCDLAFGTSTGALGLRKFPNPRFDAEGWRKLNGGRLGTWNEYDHKLSNRPEESDSRVSRLLDGSIEPPFLVGMSCGACHISFDAANPPKNPTHPAWSNIQGAIGNQYTRMSEIMASGMPRDSLEWQIFAHARPGAVDTSAVPNDQVNNPGTMNAIVNFSQRPTFAGETVDKWRKVKQCAPGASEDVCWCEPGRTSKCWEKGKQTETVHHILKDGGDSIGVDEAIQRVYLNIGSCAEPCWLNHLTDLRQIDPEQRNFGQTPADIGQCRRDCPNFRAIEDRLDNIRDFLVAQRPTDLYKARGLHDPGDLEEQLDEEFGAGAVARGRRVFAQNCARCHSSQTEPFENVNFLETVSLSNGQTIRKDWMGNDQATLASEVGTYRCRALHSNHMKGHVWQEYASETYRSRPVDDNEKEPADGGRGYYRNISLLSLWAHAPFMHNNAIGPEICGSPADPADDFYRPPYVDAGGNLLASPPSCWPYDPSVEGRFKLYKASMRDLLYPKKRIPKITKLDYDIVLDVGPRIWDGEEEKKLAGMTLRVPKGTNAALLGNFQHKRFVIDLILARTAADELQKELEKRFGAERSKTLVKEIRAMSDEVMKSPSRLVTIAGERLPTLLEVYSSCAADVENQGHRFGEDLVDADKRALTAFLATL
jgi:hypothetical protein